MRFNLKFLSTIDTHRFIIPKMHRLNKAFKWNLIKFAMCYNNKNKNKKTGKVLVSMLNWTVAITIFHSFLWGGNMLNYYNVNVPLHIECVHLFCIYSIFYAKSYCMMINKSHHGLVDILKHRIMWKQYNKYKKKLFWFYLDDLIRWKPHTNVPT